MRYKIGEIANLLSITRESIRSYEDMGIITPERHMDNNYRGYNMHDLGVLIRCRLYRQYGFKLKETAELLNDCEIDDVADMYRVKKKELQEEIMYKLQVMKNLQQWETIMSHAKQCLGEFNVVSSPALYSLEFIEKDELVDDKIVRNMAREWLKKIPFVYTGGYISNEDVINNTVNIKMFCCFEEKDKELVQIKYNENVKYWPSKMCIHTVIEVKEHTMEFQDLEPSLNYIKKNGLSLTGHVLIRTITSIKKDTSHTVYYDAWFSVE